MNLLKETEQILKENNKTGKDVLWCGSIGFGYFSWKVFKKIANVEYNEEYGAQKVADDLIICGKDFWLERHEYDGKEWWEFKEIPNKPNKKIKLKALTIEQAKKKNFNVSCGWEDLKKINGIK